MLSCLIDAMPRFVFAHIMLVEIIRDAAISLSPYDYMRLCRCQRFRDFLFFSICHMLHAARHAATRMRHDAAAPCCLRCRYMQEQRVYARAAAITFRAYMR